MQIQFNEQDLKNPETRVMLLALLGIEPDGQNMRAAVPRNVVSAINIAVRADTQQASTALDEVAEAARQTVQALNAAADAGAALTGAPSAPPAPAPAAPSAPAATAGSDMFDSEGFPWDARIHSETRNKNADGSWRIRRGVDKDLVVAVRAEFKNGGPNAAELMDTVPAAAPTPPASAPAFGGELPAGAAPLPEAAPAAPTPAAPAAPAPSAPVAPSDDTAWPTAILGEPSADKGQVQLFMEYAMGLIQDGKIQSTDILAIAQTEGLKTLVAVGTFPEKIPVLVRKIQAHIGA